MQDTIRGLEVTILEQQCDIIDLEASLPQQMVTRSTGGETWPSFVVGMLLELLAHRTTLSCILPNISTITSAILPGQDIIKQLPTTWLYRQMQTVLLHTTKTLVAFQLSGVPKFDQLLTDGTDWHNSKMENVIIGSMTDNSYKCITLSLSTRGWNCRVLHWSSPQHSQRGQGTIKYVAHQNENHVPK